MKSRRENHERVRRHAVMKAFHAQLGERVRTQDALRVASSFFSDGLEKFKAGELELALSLFEQTLAVNQKYAPMCKTIWLRPRPAGGPLQRRSCSRLP